MLMLPFARLVAGSVVVALLSTAIPASAQGSLSGRDLRLLIGLNSGSYQVYGQLFGKHLKQRLPDSSVTIETDDRAAGKMAAKRLLEAPDGQIVLGMLSNNMFYEYLLNADDSDYVFAPTDFRWVGRFTDNSRVLFTSVKSGISSLAELRAHPDPVFVPTVKRVMSQTYQETLLLNAALGLHLKPVPGYGGEATNLALLNGEGMAYNGSYLGRRPLVESGDLNVVLKIGGRNWHASLGKLPTLRDEARPGYSRAVDFIEFCARNSRWLVASPRLSPQDLKGIREVFNAIVTDPTFVNDLKHANVPLSPLSGAEMEARVRGLFGAPGPYRAALQRAAVCGLKRAENIDEDC